MSIITISRGSYSKGKEIAEKVAQKLNYDVISRDIILEASDEFNIPEIKLIRAIHDAPSILDKFTHGKARKISYMRLSLLRHFQKDNVVYHGLAGHFFVRNIAHALKVRIIADMEDRIRLEMEREGISRREALRILKNDDEQRRKWSRFLYGIDTRESCLYDLVVHIRKITVSDAVDIICHTVNQDHFRTTVQSRQAMNDLLLLAEVETALGDFAAGVKVVARDGVVTITGKQQPIPAGVIADMEKMIRQISGVADIQFPESAGTDYSNPWYKM